MVLAAVHWNMFHPERNTLEKGCGKTKYETTGILQNNNNNNYSIHCLFCISFFYSF